MKDLQMVVQPFLMYIHEQIGVLTKGVAKAISIPVEFVNMQGEEVKHNA